ncbi:MAG: DUF3795 domain-containing protein [Candidatus Bathyarchaeota archaeon]|nr:DUF3795 domain-containing protein [Candidatus Bathyarchaeota archaeon]
MGRMVGCCGIICSDCPVLIATQKDDDAERKRVAEIFTRQYGKEYKPEVINCDGCISDSSRIFSYCNLCEIRKCGREKKVKNCAYCPEYPCGKLSELFSKYSKAKETLDEIRRELSLV